MKNFLFSVTTILIVIFAAACSGQIPAQMDVSLDPPASSADLEPAAPTQTESQPTETDSTTATAGTTADNTAVSFADDVMPILEAKCIKCHGVQSKKEGLNLRTYDDILKGSRNGVVLVPGNADDSLFVQLIIEGEMPNRGTKVTPDELQLIMDWVNQGALNN